MPDLYTPISQQQSNRMATDSLADYIVDILNDAALQLACYNNNVSPSPTNTLANFQETTFGGYSRFNVLAAGFQAVNLDTQNNAYANIAGAPLFQCDGTAQDTVYGTLLIASTGGTQATATNPGNSGAYSPGFTITNGGTTYTGFEKVTLSGATGSGATAAIGAVVNGVITDINLITPGSGYTTYTVSIETPKKLIKQNVLSNTGILMALSTDAIPTTCQLTVQPTAA